MSDSNLGTLTFTLDPDFSTTKLVLRGPELPVVGTGPAIGVQRDAKGFHFLVGGGDTVVAADNLSAELKKLLNGKPTSGQRSTDRLPSRENLTPNGKYDTYQEYKMKWLLNHSTDQIKAGDKPLPEVLFNALIQFYHLIDCLEPNPYEDDA